MSARFCQSKTNVCLCEIHFSGGIPNIEGNVKRTGVNGKNDDNIYFTEHHENFDRFKPTLTWGDLKYNHVDKRQYTCSPEFFKTIIEGDNAFKWLAEHFTKYLSELNNFFQVIPYQWGEGNDTILTYYTYLHNRFFYNTSKLPRRK